MKLTKEQWDAAPETAEMFAGVMFDERNVHKQCRKCNFYLDGNELAYRERLVQRFGSEWVEQLEQDANATRYYKWTDEELSEIKTGTNKVYFMKLKQPKYFVVLKKEYRPIPIIFEADWETDLSFGQRGESYDCVRYSRSTGTMYSKNSCSWKSFDNRNDAIDLYNELLKYQGKIDNLLEQIREQTELMHGHINKLLP